MDRPGVNGARQMNGPILEAIRFWGTMVTACVTKPSLAVEKTSKDNPDILDFG